MAEVALGFRAHIGWAALVAIADGVPMPVVLRRTRVDLVRVEDREKAAADHGFVYHWAREVDLRLAEGMIATARRIAGALAGSAIDAVVAELASKGHDVASCGIVAGNARLPDGLSTILRSHALIHAAEGELFRRALAEASVAHGLPVTRIAARDLHAKAASALGVTTDEVRTRLARATNGKPWGRDQKEATLAAWLTLVERK